MSATATAPKKRSAPKGPTKKKLTVDQAGEQWVKAKRAIARHNALAAEAAEVLFEHFEKTGKKTWRDRIALVTNPPKSILDQPKVKAFLGAKLPQFMKRTQSSKSLSLLE
jgi:streptogramin lyase